MALDTSACGLGGSPGAMGGICFIFSDRYRIHAFAGRGGFPARFDARDGLDLCAPAMVKVSSRSLVKVSREGLGHAERDEKDVGEVSGTKVEDEQSLWVHPVTTIVYSRPE